jgi:hypothetical protein
MIKDIVDSKRVNTLINTNLKNNAPEEAVKIDTLIVSSLFWPPFREENFTVPEPVKRYVFSSLKASVINNNRE